MSNERGHYGPRPQVRAAARPGAYLPWPPPQVGAEAGPPRSKLPWVLGGAALVAVGITLLSAYAKRQHQGPGPSAHDREVRAWEKEFPGLPWYMDQVKDSEQLDTWERARDHWERTR